MLVQQLAGKDKDSCFLTINTHVYPDFLGNRSPLADPDLRGMVTKYLATINTFPKDCSSLI